MPTLNRIAKHRYPLITWLLFALVAVTCGCEKSASGSDEASLAVEIVDTKTNNAGTKFGIQVHGPSATKLSAAGVTATIPASEQQLTTLWIETAKLRPGQTIEVTAEHRGKKSLLEVTYALTPAVFVESRKVGCRNMACDGHITGPAELTITVPSGTEVRFGGARAVATDDPVTLAADLDTHLERATVGQIFNRPQDEYRYEIPLTLSLGDGTDLATAAPGKKDYLAAAVNRRLAGLAKGEAVRFPADGASDESATLVLGVKDDPWLVGDGTYLRDIGYVAMGKSSRVKTASCGTYANEEHGSRGLQVARVDVDLVLYDRRSGERLAEKHFDGHLPRCPQSIHKQSRKLISGRPTKAVEAWLVARR